jgi:hypothetical protein
LLLLDFHVISAVGSAGKKEPSKDIKLSPLCVASRICDECVCAQQSPLPFVSLSLSLRRKWTLRGASRAIFHAIELSPAQCEKSMASRKGKKNKARFGAGEARLKLNFLGHSFAT